MELKNYKIVVQVTCTGFKTYKNTSDEDLAESICNAVEDGFGFPEGLELTGVLISREEIKQEIEVVSQEEIKQVKIKQEMEVVCELPPSGYRLYRQANEVGGYVYWSDEVGGGIHVWDTSLTYPSTLIAALHAENIRVMEEKHKK